MRVIVAALYTGALLAANGALAQDLAALQDGDMRKLVLHESPVEVSTTAFEGDDGAEMTLQDLRGEVVVVNFWATWCAPCRAEMPAIDAVYRAQRERGFEVLAIDVQEREEDVLQFLREVGVSFPSALDRDGDVARRYRATGLPTTFLIDRQGIIRDVRAGPLTESMLEERLAKIL
jgi:thiol-disulfide isomerase/thioredoxin